MAVAAGRLRRKVEKEGEVDRVHRLLKRAIIEAELRPGDFLSDVRLAHQCNTSRTPVREACNRLAQEKWISRIPHKGYLIPPITAREIVDIYEFRKLIECFNAEKVAITAGPDQVKELGRVVDLEGQSKRVLNEILDANQDFHQRLAHIAGNQRVIDQLRITLEYVHRLDILSTQRDSGWVSHGDVLAAIEAHKPTAARDAMAVHIDHSRDRMLKLFGG